ncbi:hypothetical protein CPAL_20290 [Clostridium thermopalmarium DSM 5974]|uniref:Uncharacterized protein n=1 Tax=Clostridium thermopalmarium DSM 5974 TaxID=1121340 RepID=A0A2T0APJ8_9CLOT|nr:hypothetical protein CPAL_20290 [Clostridium thermopalmarium DSM 5974]
MEFDFLLKLLGLILLVLQITEKLIDIINKLFDD